MIRKILTAFLLLIGFSSHAAIQLEAPWGVAFDYTICLPDYAEPKDFQATITFAAGDVQISQDAGTFINVGGLPTHLEAGCWDQNITDTEMQGDDIVIYYVDTATKVFMDSQVTISTTPALPFVFRAVAEAAGTSTTTELPTPASTVDDTYNKLMMHVVAGTGVGQSAAVTDYVGSTTRQLIHQTLLTATSTDSVIYLAHDNRVAINCSAGVCQSDVIQIEGTDATDQIHAAVWVADSITAAIIATDAITNDEVDILTLPIISAGGNADSGTTTTMVDATLNQTQTDYWKGLQVLFVETPNVGQSACITAFDPAADEITFAPAVPTAITTENYVFRSTGGCQAIVQAMETDAITAQAIASNAIGALEIADDAITANKIATDAIGNAQIAASAIGSSEIAANAIGSSEIADDAINANKIATGAIGATEIAAGAITAAKFATAAITADAIATDAIGSEEIAANAIGAIEIATAAIDADAIATDAIGSAEIATDAIGALELAATAVDEIWDEVVEIGPPTITARCMMQIAGAYMAGEWTQAGSVITYQDSGGNGAVIVGTIQSPGFDSITITCP